MLVDKINKFKFQETKPKATHRNLHRHFPSTTDTLLQKMIDTFRPIAQTSFPMGKSMGLLFYAMGYIVIHQECWSWKCPSSGAKIFKLKKDSKHNTWENRIKGSLTVTNFYKLQVSIDARHTSPFLWWVYNTILCLWIRCMSTKPKQLSTDSGWILAYYFLYTRK